MVVKEKLRPAVLGLGPVAADERPAVGGAVVQIPVGVPAEEGP